MVIRSFACLATYTFLILFSLSRAQAQEVLDLSSLGAFSNNKTMAFHDYSPGQESPTLRVSAAHGFQPTGVRALKRTVLTLEQVGGSWITHSDKAGHTDARGCIGCKASRNYLLPGADEGSLIGQVRGWSDGKVVWSKPFSIGREGTVQMPFDGELWLSANDEDYSSSKLRGWEDNEGAVKVKVRVQ